MLSVRSRVVFGALRLPAAGTRRNLSQLTMGFEEIAKWKEDKRAQRTNCGRKQPIYDIKVYNPSRLSNSWNIFHPESAALPSSRAAAPRLQEAMNSAVPSTTPQGERLTLISRIITMMLQINPSAPAPPMAALPALPSVPETEDYTLPYDPVFSGPRSASQIIEVPCLNVLRKIVSGAPQTVSIGVPVPPVAPLIRDRAPYSPELFSALSRFAEIIALSKSTDRNSNSIGTPQSMSISVEQDNIKERKEIEKKEDNDDNKRTPPRNPEELKLKDTGSGCTDNENDPWKNARRELPLFLGGGPFV